MPEKFMLKALQLSRQALPACQPNPPVGCVLVRNNQIVGQGYTQKIGGNHAEVEALNNYFSADGHEQSNGDTQPSMLGVVAYVTLEPCSFVGRTPACAVSLVQQGIEKVVIAMLDPDPRNSGKGMEILQNAGVEVELGLCEHEVSEFLLPYLGKS